MATNSKKCDSLAQLQLLDLAPKPVGVGCQIGAGGVQTTGNQEDGLRTIEVIHFGEASQGHPAGRNGEDGRIGT